MDIASLLDLYAADPRLKQITDVVDDPTCPKLHLTGLVGSQSAVIASASYKMSPGPKLFILESKEQAAYFLNDLQGILDKKDCLFFSDSFKKPGEIAEVNKSNILLRAETLSKLINSSTTGEILVSYPEALFEKVVDTRTLEKSTIKIKIEEALDVDFLTEVLNEYGFEYSDPVYEPGQYAIRGGIVDIYSYGNDLPYRVELFGDEVESIRVFDPLSQNSKKKLSKVMIVPNIQTHFESDEKASLLEMLPDETVVWMRDWVAVEERVESCYSKALSVMEEIGDFKTVDEESVFGENPEASFQNSKDIKKQLSEMKVIEFGADSIFDGKLIPFLSKVQPAFNKQFDRLIADFTLKQKDGYNNYIFTDQPRQILRFESIFEDMDSKVKYQAVKVSLQEGFIDVELKLACYTDHQIFDRYHKYKIKQSFSKRNAISIKMLNELRKGDYVTHIDHGVGVFSGLQKLEVNGKTQEAVRLKYKDNDLLYVGIHSLHKISKYIGKEGRAPKINKLGSASWATMKSKTKRKIKEIARDLIVLYSKRRATEGFAFSPDTFLQSELEASFIYEDTPDQYKATQDIKEDMEAPNPMDRLICGDVGFGKTEIAIRAAAKAVADNKQVAVLVPTTILVMQHYKTFKDRFKDFPTEIDYLNRFKTAKQKKETLVRLKEGKVNIIIGTHSLAGKSVSFQDLGLLIVDEEQKFGVGAKEKIRELRINVDTLTLTATPIPRTLQFSLMGARDLSVIRTPPPNRQPINTELMTFHADKIRDAIYFEISRGGQVFFVHNRVKDIVDMAVMIEKLCPDLEIGVAHGQMKNAELEDKMIKFETGVFDILISTNIVESGLDIPNANTMIINNAHWFGLSDLHQLRGRVGRSNKKAFCYLISPPIHGLPDDSQRRLRTIEQFSDLGGGFDIAMKDLDIRGAGNMLGGEQSGFIADIGFDTYQKILDEAITELKETEFKQIFDQQLKKEKRFVRDCTVESDLEMHIPDKYVQNIDERMSLYTELNKIEDESQLIAYRDKIKDRFGPLPLPVNELIYGVRIKWAASRLGFERIIIKNGKLRCFFIENKESHYYASPIFVKVLAYVQNHGGLCNVKETPKNLIIIFEGVASMKEARGLLIDILEALGNSETGS